MSNIKIGDQVEWKERVNTQKGKVLEVDKYWATILVDRFKRRVQTKKLQKISI